MKFVAVASCVLWAGSSVAGISTITVVSGGTVHNVELNNTTKLNAVNLHPNFKQKGQIDYLGSKVKDVVGKGGDEDEIVFVDKSATYIIGVRRKEISEGVVLATMASGKELTDAEFGVQMIYSALTVEKYPFLAHRNFWLWWTKVAIVGNSRYSVNLPDMRILENPEVYTASINFPKLYGRASYADLPTISKKTLRKLRITGRREIVIKQLTGQEVRLPIKVGTTFLLDDPDQPTYSALSGGISLYAVDESKKNIDSFLETWHFISSIAIE